MGEAVLRGGGGRMETEEEVEDEVVEVEDGGDGACGVVKWERFLPRMVLRVLLVEADDSTRQIITALLRKCSYKVVAVPDGLKAWELLKGRPHNIDLILTEVDLPAVSGFALLTLIMEHKICKNIPVIMMSSHDAVSTVFSCMLKGAADYLVKPIRKNELKNLWQHVWRRQSSSSSGNGNGDGNGQQDETVALQKVEAMAENNGTSNNSSGYLACVERDNELIEKGSDAQSSCTKPELEIDFGETEQTPDLPHPGCEKNTKSELCRRDGIDCISTLLTSHDNATTNPVREVINLIETFDNQTVADCTSNYCIKGLDLSPELDLSLRRSDSGSFVSPKAGERGTLKHSDASAFSRYVNKSLNTSQSSSASVSLLQKEHGGNQNTVQHAAAHRESDVPYLAPSTPSKISLAAAQPRQSEYFHSCSRQNVFPAPSPVRGLLIENPSKDYGSAFLKVCQAQSGSSPIPSPCTVGRPEPFLAVDSIQSFSYENNLVDRMHDPINQNGSIPSFQSRHMQEFKFDHLEDQGRASSGTDRSATSSFCNGTLARLNSNECGSICASNGNVNQAPLVGHAGENGHGHGFVSLDGISQRSTQREAALAKFRIKRKDRCFEKKVRYESRKKLADKRPRVKGQFVRQVPNDPTILG